MWFALTSTLLSPTAEKTVLKLDAAIFTVSRDQSSVGIQLRIYRKSVQLTIAPQKSNEIILTFYSTPS